MNSYLILLIEGNIDRFLLKCNINNINILSINYISYKTIKILINKNDYKKLIKIKGSFKIKILDKKGINKYIEILKKYRIMFISFFISILLLIFLSNIIFEVQVVGDNKKLNSLILKELSNNNIEKYKFIKNKNKNEIIKNKILKKYRNNIEWINIKRTGVKYTINYVERKINVRTNSNEIYSVVAKKSGIVKDIYSYEGVSLINKNDYVLKGDVLISSDIYVNDELKNRVNADGKVYAEVWYKVNIEYPLNYVEKKYTGNKKKIPYIKLSNKYLEIFKYKNYDRKKKVLYKNNLSNLELGIEEIREVKNINKKYSNKEALKQAIKASKEKLELKLNNDEKIINEKTLNFYSNGSKIIVDIFFSVYEEIGEKKVIEEGEEYDRENIRESS